MKDQFSVYWFIISIILLTIATYISISYLSNLNKINNNSNPVYTCKDLEELYKESFYKTIIIKGFVNQNCNINNVYIPEGEWIIIFNMGNITYK